MSARPCIGVVALARATFDVPYAETMAADAFALLDTLPVDLVGPRDLLFDPPAAERAIERLKGEALDRLLVLQVTFTDAAMTVALAEAIPAPLVLWAFPEPRSGGRLRLNALCGINLAAHALGRAGRDYGYLYAAPDEAVRDRLEELIALPCDSGGGRGPARSVGRVGVGARTEPSALEPSPPTPSPATAGEGAIVDLVVDRLAKTRLGLLGRHPDGFTTCAYDPVALKKLVGVEIESVDLPSVFAAAAAVPADRVEAARARAEAGLAGLDEVEQESLEKSFRVYEALKDLAESQDLDGLAVRCWPEFFTEYGCAACGPMAMLSQDGRPCACEADVHGNVTSLMLQTLAEEPVFMADLVDVDRADDTAVFWHCGLAPLSMADPAARPRATIHSNRRKPLLNEFALKPGRITVARLTQARNRMRLAIGGAEMLRAPKSFSGTSGVVRFDRPAGDVLDSIMEEGLEHHYSFAYGDHRVALRAVADRLGLPVLDLC